ncbi:MAG TPA: gamma-glutamylcyclotransferase [Candidatus Kaiserbacteria bacterium]|nr:gamma-glutamylcyclotransferase [Candidatus Kaiserbacteria bacterium]
MTTVFVYGTLIFSEVVFALLGKNFNTQDAVLEGFRRYKIFDDSVPRKYPAICESSNDKVAGKVLFDVDEESLKVLDFFEGKEYKRKKFPVLLDGREISVFTYVWDLKYRENLKLIWSPQEFKEKYLNEYISEITSEVLD